MTLKKGSSKKAVVAKISADIKKGVPRKTAINKSMAKAGIKKATAVRKK